jgi:hypothetical protein
MCIETLTPNMPQFTLLKKQGNDVIIMSHRNRPILTTDHEALIQYACVRAKMNPTATYTIKRLNSVQEI